MKTLKEGCQVLVAIILLAISAPLLAQDYVDLENEDNQVAYSIGVNIGQNLVAQQIVDGIDLTAFMAGMLDALSDDVKMEQSVMMEVLQSFMQRQADEAQAALGESLLASEAFLAENAERDGVVVLESGLQYEVLASGVGGESPTTTNTVLAHYHGTLSDGSVFDSSVERGDPASFGVSQVIAGWTEALQLMTVGDKWRLYIHPDMAYGEASPTPAIPPNSALIFEVELLEIN
ncbi:MAG: peptidylprolyl isomerase [Gammaproteobacteria bacterium]|uniref:Peptidyl-prolyl cis-trans isomerase n=1 Tax=OM182 bacterium MED-G28 TaxID=1986256 RepID=A0A2A5WFR9_9GAMM|nr:peptidylprolyl isomerase [Gammaproteobacteria bacterium]PDH35360.1 MAG: peptidylprolyl isomerase [OM182 bacterium MED-G28]